MYQAGDFADEATHKNFHDHLPELRFTVLLEQYVKLCVVSEFGLFMKTVLFRVGQTNELSGDFSTDVSL